MRLAPAVPLCARRRLWCCKVWDSDLKLVLTPLDATDEVPVTKDYVLRLVSWSIVLHRC